MRHERHLAARFDVTDEPMQHALLRATVCPVKFLDEDADRAAASKPNPPRRVVLDAEFKRSRLARCDHLGGLGDDFRLDTTSGD